MPRDAVMPRGAVKPREAVKPFMRLYGFLKSTFGKRSAAKERGPLGMEGLPRNQHRGSQEAFHQKSRGLGSSRLLS